MPKKNEKKQRLSVKRVVSDNMFMLRMIRASVPFLIGSAILMEALLAVVGFLNETYFLRYALNSIEEGIPFWNIAAVLAVLSAVSIVLRLVWNWYSYCWFPTRLEKVKKDMHDRVYRAAVRMDLGCYEDPAYYDQMVKAINEAAERAQSMVEMFREFTYFVVCISTNLFLLIAIDPVLSLFSLASVPVSMLGAKVNKMEYDRKMAVTEESRKRDYARRVFYLADYAKEMRLTNMQALMLRRFRESGARIQKIIRNKGLQIAAVNYILVVGNEVFIILGATVYALWNTMETGRMGYGDCLVVLASIMQVAFTLPAIATRLLKFQESALYIEDLRKFLEAKPTIRDGSLPLPECGELVLEDVSFRYEGAAEDTLKGITMRIRPGEKVAIVGHNGAGKTTLVKLLLRLYDCEGCIRYGGEDIRSYSVKEYRDMFVSVMQESHVFALTVGENVLLRGNCSGDEGRVRQALEKSGLWEKIGEFDRKADTMLTREFDDRGQNLSGGEAQKLSIAHVYTKDSRFVILDEPSSALDPIAEHEMYNRMMESCADRGVIFISHRLSSAVMADRIYLLENGTVVEAGTHRELMEANGKYAQMFRRQARNYAEAEL